ncbi:DUF3995 domain-containing protein [Nocardioides speluncae]|uniref:DUF3995 domain-containing protein n=1 Tax=Nocardioides speluncae TaxID=2670337 RepID=UPI00137A4D46|nr:DUF3995 domain-containing protein [Nocardioides speluncae]
MQTVGIVAALALVVIAVFHVVWVVSPWPLATREELARNVVGRADGSLPLGFFVPASIGVAAALGFAAYLVSVQAGAVSSSLSEDLVRLGTWGCAAVLLGRGGWGLLESGLKLGNAPASYRRLDLICYSPLCLVLGGLIALVALR